MQIESPSEETQITFSLKQLLIKCCLKDTVSWVRPHIKDRKHCKNCECFPGSLFVSICPPDPFQYVALIDAADVLILLMR